MGKKDCFSSTQIDRWVWGEEAVVWGNKLEHKFTLKILKPRAGKEGLLSLQYHEEKEEVWVVYSGVGWILLAFNGIAGTRIVRRGDYQILPSGVIHRIMALDRQFAVIEASSLDAHAADKSSPKDVVRLHCAFGRECKEPSSKEEESLISKCIELTEEAVSCWQKGIEPPQHNLDWVLGQGGGSISSLFK